jgi:hypothetical protein
MGESLMKTDKEIIGIVAAHAMRHRDTITLVLPPGATIANIAELEHEKGVRMLLVKSFKQRKGRLEFTKSEYTDLIESFFDLDMAISPFLAKFLGLIDHVTDAAGRPATFQKKETKKTKTERGLIRE